MESTSLPIRGHGWKLRAPAYFKSPEVIPGAFYPSLQQLTPLGVAGR
jgi:hypothetical protein